MTTTYLNEVDLPAVGALVQAVQEDPEKGQTTWQSEVTWEGAFRTTARSRDLEPIAFDEPPGLGGTNTAPNPVEQLLGALGSCIAIGYAANASVAGIEASRALAASTPYWSADLAGWSQRVSSFAPYGWQVPVSLLLAAVAAVAAPPVVVALLVALAP